MPKNKRMSRPARPTRGSGERINAGRDYRGWTRDQPHSSFPDRELVSLDYVAYNRVNPGVVVGAYTVFALNSAFDPDVSGVGHQPRDFDTWASIYAKYRVLRTLVEVDVRQRAAHGLHVVVVPSNSATAFTAADLPAELPRAVYIGITGSSQPVASYRGAFDPRAILGMTQAEFRGDDSTGALVTASPAQLVYLHLFGVQVDATTVCDWEYSLRLRMEIEFYDRKVLSPSALIAQALRMARAGQSEESGGDGVIVPAPAPATTVSLQQALASALASMTAASRSTPR